MVDPKFNWQLHRDVLGSYGGFSKSKDIKMAVKCVFIGDEITSIKHIIMYSM